MLMAQGLGLGPEVEEQEEEGEEDDEEELEREGRERAGWLVLGDRNMGRWWWDRLFS